jgi:hypothetical protein
MSFFGAFYGDFKETSRSFFGDISNKVLFSENLGFLQKVQ